MKAAPVFRGKIASDCAGVLWDSPQELMNLKKHLQSIGWGQPVEVIIRKPRKHRSNNQNAYYWHVICEMVGKKLMYGCSKDEAHEALLAKHSRDLSTGLHPDLAPIIRSSQMSTVEFEDYCQRIRQWAFHEYQFRIPEPNEVDV